MPNLRFKTAKLKAKRNGLRGLERTAVGHFSISPHRDNIINPQRKFKVKLKRLPKKLDQLENWPFVDLDPEGRILLMERKRYKAPRTIWGTTFVGLGGLDIGSIHFSSEEPKKAFISYKNAPPDRFDSGKKCPKTFFFDDTCEYNEETRVFTGTIDIHPNLKDGKSRTEYTLKFDPNFNKITAGSTEVSYDARNIKKNTVHHQRDVYFSRYTKNAV